MPQKLLKVVFTGAECTGKTTLVKKLAEIYQMPYVPEASRLWVEEKKREIVFEDVESIADFQMACENKIKLKNPPFLLCDTDLVSTCVYSEFYFGKVSNSLFETAQRNLGDIYFLCDPEIPWEDDPGQRSSEENRLVLHELFKLKLEEIRVSYFLVKGSLEQRLTFCISKIASGFS
jgi:nicotinamide riboside kinase